MLCIACLTGVVYSTGSPSFLVNSSRHLCVVLHMSRRSSSFPTALLPRFPGLRFEQAQLCDQILTLRLRTEQPHALCPQCGNPSFAVHSRYTRMPTDLPWSGYAVRFILHVRKFFCRTLTCAQRIFTERLPGVVEPLARKTVRLH